jgi:DNA (cytosine-5)-methyltransferase 1
MAARSSKAPRVIDLFCGAGGLSEGLSRAGFQIVAAADMDPIALRTLALNHPSLPPEGLLAGDIRELDRQRLRRLVGRRRLDVLAGAPPCQGFSSAGFRSKSTHTGYRAIGDERNYLFEWLVGIALELEPRLFLMENVPGMKSARRQDVSFLESAARRLRAGGYITALWQLNAAAFGVPQERTRCFLVAAAPDVELPAQPTEEYQNTRSAFDVDALPPITLTEAIFDLPQLKAGTGTAVARNEGSVTGDDLRLRRYLRKFQLREPSKLIYNHYARYQNEQDLELYALLRPGEDSVHAIERYGRADLMRYRRDVFDDKYFRLRGDRPSKTIVSHLAKDGNGYIHPTQTRGITPREAARLQSFHDRYAFCGSPTDQWSQIGNAVPPVMAEAIARSLLAALRRAR